MSDHAEAALDMLERVANLDKGDDSTPHYELGHALVGAIVHSLLDVAAALRERPE